MLYPTKKKKKKKGEFQMGKTEPQESYNMSCNYM